MKKKEQWFIDRIKTTIYRCDRPVKIRNKQHAHVLFTYQNELGYVYEEMSVKKAISILEKHNKWRRGGKGEMIDPTILGIAIDTIVNNFK